MNVYFFFNLQSQSFLCHEMAKCWQNEYPGSEFSGAIVGKTGLQSSFLETQQDISYRHLDSIDDIERDALGRTYSREKIDLWESRFSEPLWRLVLADRVIGRSFVKGGLYSKTAGTKTMDHDSIIHYVLNYLDFFEKRLGVLQPDMVVFPAIASLPSLALAWVCQYLGIPYYILLYTRILDRYIIIADSVVERINCIEKDYYTLSENLPNHVELSSDLEVYLKSFQETTPEQTYDFKLLTGRQKDIKQEPIYSFSKDIVARFIDACCSSLRSGVDQKTTWTKLPFSHMKVEVLRRIKIRYFNDSFFCMPEIGAEPYVFFPLHVNPEASTMIYAPDFVDQLAVIEALAKNIPLSHKLYVKEHPIMIGLRPSKFYEAIKRYPNVRLISPYADNFSCIRNADLVSVITSTAGWEGLLMGRPVITFGNSIYTHLDLTKSCTDYSKLGFIISNLIEHPEELEAKKYKIRVFLKLLDEHSFSIPDVLWTRKFGLEGLRSDEIEAVHTVCREIIKIHQLKSSD